MKIRLYKGGKRPEYTKPGDSAMDCFAAHDCEWKLEKGSYVADVRLGFGCLVPKDYGLFILSRSGQGFNHHQRLINSVGLIDNSYGLNEIRCKLKAPVDTIPKSIKKGDRVCQMVLIYTPEIFWEKAKEYIKGKEGFGSSGV